MTILTLATLSLSALALFASIAACVVAFRGSGRSLRKQFAALSERFADLELAMEANATRMRSVRAQVNAYSRNRNSELPELTGDSIEAHKDRWTKEMNLAIATGKFRIPGR